MNNLFLQPSWAYYDSRGNVAREDGRGTAKSLREIKQEREAELERSRNRARNGEQGRNQSSWGPGAE